MAPSADHTPVDRLRAELEEVRQELREHMASWEYAFAMGDSRHGASEHPVLWATRAKTERLLARRADLQARLREYEL